MKKIRVYRETGFVGMLGALHLKLNGNKIAKIYNKEWLEIPLVDDEAILQTSTFGQKSNKVKVNNGEDILLSSTFWGTYGLGFAFFLLIFSSLLRNTFLSGITIILALFIFVTAFIPGFHHKLEKLE